MYVYLKEVTQDIESKLTNHAVIGFTLNKLTKIDFRIQEILRVFKQFIC